MTEISASTRRLELLLLGGVLVLHVIVAVLSNRPDLIWDEGRYLLFATHLTQGFYVSPENPDIINGPGYPLVLAPLVLLKAPLLMMRALNAFFMALAAWFTFRAVLPYAGKRWALAVALITALHPSLVRTAPYLMTEALAVACIAGFAWAFTAALRAPGWRWGFIAAAVSAFAALTMTRVFFGNVLMVMLVLLPPLALLWRGQRAALLRALTVMALSFVMCVPWLAYTKAKTGENFCWSTVGGELLYWITSTNEGENGHWFSVEDAQTKPELVAHHRELFLPYYDLPVKEREERFKKRAGEQLRANPSGVFKNWLCNWSRLLFGFPRSFQPEELTTVILIATNGPLVLSFLLACLVVVRRRAVGPVEILLLSLMACVYIGGSSVAPALPRYAVVIWPWLGLAMAAVLSRGLSVRVG